MNKLSVYAAAIVYLSIDAHAKGLLLPIKTEHAPKALKSTATSVTVVLGTDKDMYLTMPMYFGTPLQDDNATKYMIDTNLGYVATNTNLCGNC